MMCYTYDSRECAICHADYDPAHSEARDPEEFCSRHCELAAEGEGREVA